MLCCAWFFCRRKRDARLRLLSSAGALVCKEAFNEGTDDTVICIMSMRGRTAFEKRVQARADDIQHVSSHISAHAVSK